MIREGLSVSVSFSSPISLIYGKNGLPISLKSQRGNFGILNLYSGLGLKCRELDETHQRYTKYSEI